MNFFKLSLAFFLFGLNAFADSSCPKAFSELMSELAAKNKRRISVEKIAPELKPIMMELLNSGTREWDQHKKLADAVISYLSKYGAKARREASVMGGMDIVITETTPDSPFRWTLSVPKALAKQFGMSIVGQYNTNTLLNPFTPGFRGGSGQLISSSEGDHMLVFSADSLMNKRFYAPGDGHEVIHAVSAGGNTPHLELTAHNYKPTGKVGSDLYGREFSTDEIRTTYAFTVKTSLKDILKSKGESTPEDAYSEIELTHLRNGLLQDLFYTAKPIYEAALKPGAIKKSDIKEHWGWAGNRSVLIEPEEGNAYSFVFRSEQVNKWKLEQDPSASKDVDWSKDPKTIKAMIAQDYEASKRATKEANLFVDFLIGPNPQYKTFLEATQKVQQLRDFSTLTDAKAKRDQQLEAASRLVKDDKLSLALVRMQKKALKEGVSIPEGHLAIQRKDGSWFTIDGSQMEEVLLTPQK